jgi:hypothetical protein
MSYVGDVPARVPQACHEPLSDRIDHEPHDDGDRGSRTHRAGRVAIAAADDDINLGVDKLSDESRQSLGLSVPERPGCEPSDEPGRARGEPGRGFSQGTAYIGFVGPA